MKIVPATQKLIDKLCKRTFRKADDRECMAAAGRPAAEAVRRGFKRTNFCRVVLLNNKPVAAFGVTPQTVLSHVGIPWMLGTPELTENLECRKAIRNMSPWIIAQMLKRFPFLENYEDCRNTVSMKWLTWLGFEFDLPKAYGRNGELFARFWMRRASYV